MSFYKKHLFFCTNQKQAGKKCCQDSGAEAMRMYAKQTIQAMGLEAMRVNASGCLGQCSRGPCLVIYPEGVWYTYQSPADIDEIIETHLKGNKIVERLLLK